ncbi:MAG: hypothetical protein ABSB70_12655 [Candidatus Velthaea sp.]|jgi:hypothetical protein
MVTAPPVESQRSDVTPRLYRSPKALAGAAGVAAFVFVIVPLTIAVGLERRSIRADRLYRAEQSAAGALQAV